MRLVNSFGASLDGNPKWEKQLLMKCAIVNLQHNVLQFPSPTWCGRHFGPVLGLLGTQYPDHGYVMDTLDELEIFRYEIADWE